MRAVNEALALHTVMRYPDYAAAASGERPFILATDACKEGFGAVLSQADADGVEQPIAFTSRATLPNERNWSTTDLEAGAIVNGIKKFRHICGARRFTLLTDHRALQYIDSIRERTARGGRWAEFLSAFDINVVYKKGADHGNADGPSRNPLRPPLPTPRRRSASGSCMLMAWRRTSTRVWRRSPLASTWRSARCCSQRSRGGEEELRRSHAASGAEPGSWELLLSTRSSAGSRRATGSASSRRTPSSAPSSATSRTARCLRTRALATQVRKWAELCRLRSSGDAQLLVRHPAEAPTCRCASPSRSATRS